MKLQLDTAKMPDGYTICDNRIFNSNELTADAKYLYIWLTSKPADFRFYSYENVAKLSNMGFRTTRNALKLLEKHGLIKMSLAFNGRSEKHSGKELVISIFDYSHFDSLQNDSLQNDSLQNDSLQNDSLHFDKHNNKRDITNKENLKIKENLKNKEELKNKDECAKIKKSKESQSEKNITNAFNAKRGEIHHFTLDDVLEFAKHRDEIKKPITELAAKKTIEKLIEYGIGAYDSIQNSIMNGWQGIFEPKKINAENSAFAREKQRARAELSSKYATSTLDDRKPKANAVFRYVKSNTAPEAENNL